MCDTIVALGDSTADNSVIFGKNSDREPNEAHEIVVIPGARHEAGSTVKCTYIEIPQVKETYRVLLAKPFWIWGAEMGSNEHGVTIGNEAVFTRDPYGKTPGLIGMDFLRLALERSTTALEALDWIIDLMEEYGQSGNCGFAHSLYYHNSFIICDFEDAWVLETSGKEWAAEKVKGVRSISNAITIGSKWDRASKNLVAHAINKGWCKQESDFNFSKCYSEPIYTRFSDARKRQNCTLSSLQARKGSITIKDMLGFLRMHSVDNSASWSPDAGVFGATVCMHSSWGPIRGSQTTGSMVSVLKKGEPPVHWVTGTAAPCTSLFKPVWLDGGIPLAEPAPTGTYDQATRFWQHEGLHRAILRDYATRINLIREDQVAFEDNLINSIDSVVPAPVVQRRDFSEKAFREAAILELNWKDRIAKSRINHKNRILYRMAWNRFDSESKMR